MILLQPSYSYKLQVMYFIKAGWPRVATESDFSNKYAVYVPQKMATYSLSCYCRGYVTMPPVSYLYPTF